MFDEVTDVRICEDAPGTPAVGRGVNECELAWRRSKSRCVVDDRLGLEHSYIG